MGFREIQTYILASESGASLIAAGWLEDTTRKDHRVRDWNCPTRGNRRTDQPMEPKRRFYKILAPRATALWRIA